MTPERRAKLREAAWITNIGGSFAPVTESELASQNERNARYIAAASPDVLLALLDEIDRLEVIVDAGCGRCADFVTDVDEQRAEGEDEGSNA